MSHDTSYTSPSLHLLRRNIVTSLMCSTLSRNRHALTNHGKHKKLTSVPTKVNIRALNIAYRDKTLTHKKKSEREVEIRQWSWVGHAISTYPRGKRNMDHANHNPDAHKDVSQYVEIFLNWYQPTKKYPRHADIETSFPDLCPTTEH